MNTGRARWYSCNVSGAPNWTLCYVPSAPLSEEAAAALENRIQQGKLTSK